MELGLRPHREEEWRGERGRGAARAGEVSPGAGRGGRPAEQRLGARAGRRRACTGATAVRAAAKGSNGRPREVGQNDEDGTGIPFCSSIGSGDGRGSLWRSLKLINGVYGASCFVLVQKGKRENGGAGHSVCG